MSKKKKSRLGRGLGALLSDVKQTTRLETSPALPTEEPVLSPVSAKAPAQVSATSLQELPIELLQRGEYQPRISMDKAALEDLAESIRAQGIIQPLLVRRLRPDKYEIIAGERRWRGAQLAGLSTVPAVVREISDETAIAVALIENIQRQDLNAIEEALGFQRLIDEFGLTHEEVAESVGRSRAAVTNTLRLLSLVSGVRKMVESGELGMGHARALLALDDTRQLEAANKVRQGGLSVRATEHLVKRLNRKPADSAKKAAADQDVRYLENELSERIGAAVKIEHSGKRGRLVIQYYSLDELDGILARIK